MSEAFVLNMRYFVIILQQCFLKREAYFHVILCWPHNQKCTVIAALPWGAELRRKEALADGTDPGGAAVRIE